jgi:hypothetical protein
MRTMAADRLTVPSGELPRTTEVSHFLILAPGWLQPARGVPDVLTPMLATTLGTAACSWTAGQRSTQRRPAWRHGRSDRHPGSGGGSRPSASCSSRRRTARARLSALVTDSSVVSSMFAAQWLPDGHGSHCRHSQAVSELRYLAVVAKLSVVLVSDTHLSPAGQEGGQLGGRASSRRGGCARCRHSPRRSDR